MTDRFRAVKPRTHAHASIFRQAASESRPGSEEISMPKLLTRLLQLMAAIAVTAIPMQSRAEMITVTHWGSAFYGAPYAVAMEKGFFKAFD
jgi:hypothetical protein